MSGGTVSRISDHGARSAAGRLDITVDEYRQHEDRDEHWCPRCGYWLPRRAFHVNNQTPRGVGALCKWHRREEVAGKPSTRQRGITYAGPAYSTPDPAGVAVLPDAAPAGAGHLYRPVDALTATQIRQIAATADLLGVPVGVVARVRNEVAP